MVEQYKNYGRFAVIFVIGCFLIFISILMLPFIIFKVRAIANTFNAGAITILISFGVLWGAREFWIDRFFYSSRSIYAIGFTTTMGLCVYFSFLKESYFMTLILLVLELSFLLYFIASFFPGGIDGVTKMLSAGWTTITSCCR